MEIWQLTIHRSALRQDSDKTGNKFILNDCFVSLKNKFILNNCFGGLTLETKERREDEEIVGLSMGLITLF